MSSSLIRSLSIDGEIWNGICSAKYTVEFFNDTNSLVEAFFIFPFPQSCCPTEFTAEFNGETFTSTIGRSDDSSMMYDDILAQGDFGVLAQIIEDGKLKVDVGYLKKNETCKVSVSFLTTMANIDNTSVLIFPGVPASKFKYSLTQSVNLKIYDALEIKSITTPDVQKASIKLEANKHEGTLVIKEVSIKSPLRICIQYNQYPSRCIEDNYENASYLYYTAKSPLAVRTSKTDFTLMIEQGKMVDSARLSLILRAVEFFALSIPNNCSINVIKFGECLEFLYDAPRQINADIRKQTIDFTREVFSKDKNMHLFGEAQELIKETTEDSVIIVIGTNFEETTELKKDVMYIFIDPSGRGDTREFATKRGASYVPVSDQNSFFAAILSTIKMTATAPIENAKVTFDGEESPLNTVLPAVSFDRIVCVEKEEVKDIVVKFDDLDIPIPIIKDEKCAAHFLYAYNEFKNGDTDDFFALMPEDGGAVAFEREQDVAGDVTFIEAKISEMKGKKPAPIIQIIKEQRRIQKEVYQNQPKPKSIIDQEIMEHRNSRRSQQQENYSKVRRNSMKRREQRVTQMYWESSNVYQRNQRSELPQRQNQTRYYNGNYIPKQKNHQEEEKRTTTPHIHFPTDIKKPEVTKPAVKIDVPAAEVHKVKTEKPKKKTKPMFFMLRLLQLQEEDGSWRKRESMEKCVGTEIPDEYEDLTETQLLTSLAVEALIVKGSAEKEKWEILSEKAMLFLEKDDQRKEWGTVINSMRKLFH